MHSFKLMDFIDILQEIQNAYTLATGFPIMFFNVTGEPITKQDNFNCFCTLIKKEKKCCLECCKSDIHWGLEAAQLRKPIIYRCRAGLVNFAVRIIHQGKYVGYLLGGQVKLPKNEMDQMELSIKHANDLFEDEDIRDTYNRLPVSSYEKVLAGVQLMLTIVDNIATKDEISILYNEIQSKEKKLIRELKVNEDLYKASKECQLKVLQLHFKQHYLFNLTNTIESLAIIENAKKTQEVVSIMSHLLRYTVRSIGSRVSVDDEIGQIQRYLEIQAIRYGTRLSFNIDISTDVKSYSIPSNILLPFIENSIIHGIEQKESDGFVKVSSYVRGDNVIINIIDNGLGMTRERIKEIMEPVFDFPLKSNNTGVSISTLYKCMGNIYGDKFKISIKSKIGLGTWVQLRFPKSMDEIGGHTDVLNLVMEGKTCLTF